MSCAPSNVDSLVAETMDEIGKIKKDGALALDIEKFAISEARSTQVQLKQNIFWAGYIGAAAQNGDDPDAILKHVGDLEMVTPQSTKDAANKYLGGGNLIKFILLPEKK